MLRLLHLIELFMSRKYHIFINDDIVSKFQTKSYIQQAPFCLVFLFIFSLVRDSDVKYGQINLI